MSDSRPHILIIGQGLAGTALAWQAHRRGISFEIWDEEKPDQSASLAAGGVYGPITGQNLTTFYQVEAFLPEAEGFYRLVEQLTGDRFFYPLPIAHAFTSRAHGEGLTKRIDKLQAVQISVRPRTQFPSGIHAPFGGFETDRSGWLDCADYIASSRKFFKSLGAYHARTFDDAAERDHNDIWTVLATGAAIRQRPEFKQAQFSATLGESIEIEMPGLPHDHIWKKKLACIPLDQKGRFRIGSTYLRETQWREASAEGISTLRRELADWMPTLEPKARVLGARSGLRTHRQGHLPLIGRAEGKKLLALVGLGSKGVLWAPRASNLVFEHLFAGTALPSDLTL